MLNLIIVLVFIGVYYLTTLKKNTMENTESIKNKVDNLNDGQRLSRILELREDIKNGILKKHECEVEYSILVNLFYIDFVNDFISIENYADYHGIDKKTAIQILCEGKKENTKI